MIELHRYGGCWYVLARITLVDSGQSAAEIFQDLLQTGRAGRQLSWFTRSPRFFPMETTKATLELSSPDYIDYFYSLPSAAKAAALRGQDALYKGINAGLINALYDQLYEQALAGGGGTVSLHPHCELKQVVADDQSLQLSFEQIEAEKSFTYSTDALILATDYCYDTPAFLGPIRDRIRWTPAE